jgi:uncharacterized protein YecE (DUF72 family)
MNHLTMNPSKPPQGIFLGTSAWSHKHWVGNFYPPNCSAKNYLSEYAKKLSTVEIDSTFYAIPKVSVVKGWKARTPERFVFAAKFPQVITHEKRLNDCNAEVNAFLDVMSHLDAKLGPLLLQFPSGFRTESFDRLARFLAGLPDGFRYAVEIRHRGWLTERFFEVLRAHHIAFALVDSPWLPRKFWNPPPTTTDFTYIRWMGDRNTPLPDFSQIRLDRRADLQRWVESVRDMRAVKIDVYGFFNNHYAGHSPSSLQQFLELYLTDG